MNTFNIVIMEAYSIGYGVVVSLFSMLIVFLILVLLSVIFSLLKFIPFKDDAKENKRPVSAVVGSGVGNSNLNADEEERTVAMLVASCLAKDEIDGDVRVVSIERVK